MGSDSPARGMKMRTLRRSFRERSTFPKPTLRRGPGWSEPAAYALGDVAGRKKTLRDETSTALLDAASGMNGSAPLDVALYPFTRFSSAGNFADRLLSTARASLGRPSSARIF